MDINLLFGVGITLLLSYIVYKSLKPKISPFAPQRTGLLVAHDTGKSKVNQSKTGDASLFVQEKRRRVIHKHGQNNKLKLKETSTQKGSATGAIETFMITYKFSNKNSKCIFQTLDGGKYNSIHFTHLEANGGNNYYDGGKATTEDCFI